MTSRANLSGNSPSDSDSTALPFVDYTSMPLRPGERNTPQWLRNERLCFAQF